MVQEPADAAAPDMPWSALVHAGADYRVRLAEIPELLVRLADELILKAEGTPLGLAGKRVDRNETRLGRQTKGSVSLPRS